MSVTARIEVDPKIMLGKPVIRGTRIPVELLLRKLGEGATEEILLDAYPRLSREDIRAAIAYAADSLAHEEFAEASTWIRSKVVEESTFAEAFAGLRDLLAEKPYELEVPERLDHPNPRTIGAAPPAAMPPDLTALRPTERFSSRVENYVKFRPGYPPEIVPFLAEKVGVSAGDAIADVGSGTGLLSKVFLDAGFQVRGVEPNREMREAGERFLSGYPSFTSIVGTAEETSLPAESVGMIVVGQAFHWFDRARCRPEMARVLAPGGTLAVIWNERDTSVSAFLRAYEELLTTWCLGYGQVEHRRISDADLAVFFAPEPVGLAHFTNRQRFDYPGLEGRLLSSSYAPESGNPKHEPMLAALRELFDRHQENGVVSFPYDTQVYYGRLVPPSA